ncbi:unnamed protein product [Nezara viridula]|uniref:Uncharacterized protein n=1 Tax=Nezara viridula TaxID=85310 RepID=A0A9P0MXN4_NEZVI|nr:unnamed protein product [Nezara viridula]
MTPQKIGWEPPGERSAGILRDHDTRDNGRAAPHLPYLSACHRWLYRCLSQVVFSRITHGRVRGSRKGSSSAHFCFT